MLYTRKMADLTYGHLRVLVLNATHGLQEFLSLLPAEYVTVFSGLTVAPKVSCNSGTDTHMYTWPLL